MLTGSWKCYKKLQILQKFCTCILYFKSKLVSYIPFNSHGHFGAGPQHLPLVGGQTHTVVTVYG